MVAGHLLWGPGARLLSDHSDPETADFSPWRLDSRRVDPGGLRWTRWLWQGTFCTSRAEMQIRIFQLEARLEEPDSFRFPHFLELARAAEKISRANSCYCCCPCYCSSLLLLSSCCLSPQIKETITERTWVHPPPHLTPVLPKIMSSSLGNWPRLLPSTFSPASTTFAFCEVMTHPPSLPLSPLGSFWFPVRFSLSLSLFNILGSRDPFFFFFFFFFFFSYLSLFLSFLASSTLIVSPKLVLSVPPIPLFFKN